jgi:phage tail protein X
MVHKGDSLAKIAQAASVFGEVIIIEVILKANPGLDAARLRVGQKIIIPDDKAEGSTAPIPDGSIPAPNNEGTPDAPASPAPSQEPPTSGAPAGAE